MSDMALDKALKIGDKGEQVKLAQEWLCLNGFSVSLDGKFGSATELAVKRFKRKENLSSTDGIIDNGTFVALVRPMYRALAQIPVIRDKTTLGSLVVAYAQQHLESWPREVGGQNCGPWVRLYMNGREGSEYPWCAGFAMFILKQACGTLGRPMPITGSVSCDVVYRQAERARMVMDEISAMKDNALPIGSMFLVRKSARDWTHIGIVTAVHGDAFDTIEGNTNDNGSREGYEVCARIRNFENKDFVIIR